jgi:4'-phosphopantetheinyl transferase
LQFAYGPHGKPALAGGQPAEADPQFNLAHSENLALLAFAHTGAVGVDVEQVRPMPDADQLVARFFSPREQFAFKQLPDEQKPAAFFNLWTRKEAWLKATGDGIGHLLSQVEVSFLPGEPARLLSVPPSRPGAEPDVARSAGPDPIREAPNWPKWSLYHLTPAPGFTAALALAQPASVVHCWRWEAHARLGK